MQVGESWVVSKPVARSVNGSVWAGRHGLSGLTRPYADHGALPPVWAAPRLSSATFRNVS